MNTDPIADLLTRMRNAATVRFPDVSVPYSKEKKEILRVIEEGGYIAGAHVTKDEATIKKGSEGRDVLKVNLKYDTNGAPVIREIKRLSRPGRRLYVGKDDLPYHRGGLGTIVVSTSKGMMSVDDARKQGIGGELICSLF